MVKKLLLFTGLSLTALSLSAASGLTALSGVPNAISPDGRYIVGSSGLYGSEQLKSYLYDMTTGQLEWKTECNDAYGAEAPESTGNFRAVTNSGIIAGTIKNKDMVIEQAYGGGFAPSRRYVEGDEEIIRMPLNSAAVWRDGKVYTLGTADMTLEQFADCSGEDGSVGVAVSADGTKVVGYITYQWFPSGGPILWSYNAATDSYDYERLPLGNYMQGIPTAMSSDGTIVVGQVSLGDYTAEINQFPAVWVTGNDDPYILNLGFNGKAVAISPSGRYIMVSNDDYIHPYIAVYDMQLQEMRQFKLPQNVTNCAGYTISDKGDAWIGMYNNSTYTTDLYYYNVENELLLTAKEYISAYGLTLDQDISSLIAVGTSADGKVSILKELYGTGSYVLTLPQGDPQIISKPECELYFSGINKATLAWKQNDNLPEGVRMTKYNVYVDGNLATTFNAEDAAKNADGFDFSYTWDATLGTKITAMVEPAAEDADGNAVICVPASLSAEISGDTELVQFMNFNNASVNAQGNIFLSQDVWAERTYAGASLIAWHLEASDFNNNTPYFTTSLLEDSPYSSALESRFFDGTAAEDFYFTLFYQMKEVNVKDQNRSEEYLDIEYTIDGYNWKALKRINAADIQPGVWNFEAINLSDLAGKAFRLRLNANGSGKAYLKWYADNLGINDSYDGAAPTGLRAFDSAESVKLTWHNTLNQYEVSHMGNYNFYTDYNLGNDGNPLMAAVDFSPEMLADYVGNYITSVNAFIYDNPDLMTTPTHADAVVFADGVEVARASYKKEFNTPEASTIIFDSPVKIEAGKTYRVAIDLTEYAPEQTPIYYTADKSVCVPGVTDLFSEDGGATWKNVSEVLYSEENPVASYCVWPIRANISLTPEAPAVTSLDNNLLGYNVYRDGERINTSLCYAVSTLFIDLNPAENATYAVQAFYNDGLVSPLSETLTVKHSGIEGIGAADRMSISNRQGEIILGGEFDHAALYRLDGVLAAIFPQNGRLSTEGMQRGIYLLRVQIGNTVKTMKLIVTE